MAGISVNNTGFRDFFSGILADLKSDFDTCFCQIVCVNNILEIGIFGLDATCNHKKRQWEYHKPDKGCYGTYVIESWTCRHLWDEVNYMQGHCLSESINFKQDFFIFDISPS